MSTVWRPCPSIRAISIGVVRRGEEVLVVAVRDDAGAIKGWRPLGGAIEFGERANEALNREIEEEVGILPRELTVRSFLLAKDLDAPVARVDKRGFSKGKRYFFFALSYSGSGILRCDPSEIGGHEWLPPHQIPERFETTRLEKWHMMEIALLLSMKTR